jgi:hypothetical protein
MSYFDSATKNAAKYLRNHLMLEKEFRLKSSHAHELVAACLEMNSKAAASVNAKDLLDPDFPEEMGWIAQTGDFVKTRIERLGENPKNRYLLKLLDSSDQIAEVVAQALKPPCDFCGRVNDSTKIQGQKYGDPYKWACGYCVNDHRNTTVAACHFCDRPENVWLTKDLKGPFRLCEYHVDEPN